jgi:hypothetical protein
MTAVVFRRDDPLPTVSARAGLIAKSRDRISTSRRLRLRPDSGTGNLRAMEETDSRVEVYVTTDTSDAPHKAGEPKLYVMYDAAKPEAGKLYFTEAEWDAFVLGVKDGEFDLDENGNLPPVPLDQQAGQQQG